MIVLSSLHVSSPQLRSQRTYTSSQRQTNEAVPYPAYVPTKYIQRAVPYPAPRPHNLRPNASPQPSSKVARMHVNDDKALCQCTVHLPTPLSYPSPNPATARFVPSMSVGKGVTPRLSPAPATVLSPAMRARRSVRKHRMVVRRRPPLTYGRYLYRQRTTRYIHKHERWHGLCLCPCCSQRRA